MGYIYKIVNKIDGKVYVGQTKDPKRRWAEHKRLSKWSLKSKSSPLYDSMRCFGIDNFYCLILEECEENKMGEREKYWVEKLEARNPDKGYNLSIGYNRDTRRICQYDTDGTYIATYERNCDASRETGVDHSSIRQACQMTLPSCGGFLWRYEGDEKPQPYKALPRHSKPVEMYSPDGKLLHSYVSIVEAEKESGIKWYNISKCCHGAKEEAGGYIWKFANKKTP